MRGREREREEGGLLGKKGHKGANPKTRNERVKEKKMNDGVNCGKGEK